MNLARELEKRLEQLVDGLSAAVFGGRVHPVDVANRLVREADLRATDGELGPEIPNHWTVRMGPSDFEATRMQDLSRELTHALATTAAERGWRTSGAVVVDVIADDEIRSGSVTLGAERQTTPAEPWGQLLDAEAGHSHELANNRVLVGRSEEAEVRVSHPKISRRHATIFREAGKAWVKDLGSVNGTFVNAERLGAEAVVVRPGDEVTFGTATFSFRLH